MDGVDTSARAGVTASGATCGGRSLRSGVTHLIASAAATALEGVVETDPVSGFVCQGLRTMEDQ